MSLEQEAERGRLAEEVLNNPVYAEAYELIEKGVYDKWRNVKGASVEAQREREYLHQLLLMLGKARGVIETTMREGRVAQDKLAQRASLAQRIGQRLRAA